jgi:hypothetical protein
MLQAPPYNLLFADKLRIIARGHPELNAGRAMRELSHSNGTFWFWSVTLC